MIAAGSKLNLKKWLHYIMNGSGMLDVGCHIKVTCELPSAVSTRSFMKLRLNMSLRGLRYCWPTVMVRKTLHCTVLVYLFEIAFNLIAIVAALQPSAAFCFLPTWWSSCWHLKMCTYFYCWPPVIWLCFLFPFSVFFVFIFIFCFVFVFFLIFLPLAADSSYPFCLRRMLNYL